MLRVLLIFTFFTVVLFGEDINTLIKKLHSTPPNQRYKIMNQIKLKLIELNSIQRAKVLNRLKAKMMQKDKAHKFKNHMGMGHQKAKDAMNHQLMIKHQKGKKEHQGGFKEDKPDNGPKDNHNQNNKPKKPSKEGHKGKRD